MKLAAKRAVELGKPWVLDPVGCGATPYRTQVGRFCMRQQLLLLAWVLSSGLRRLRSSALPHAGGVTPHGACFCLVLGFMQRARHTATAGAI